MFEEEKEEVSDWCFALPLTSSFQLCQWNQEDIQWVLKLCPFFLPSSICQAVECRAEFRFVR